MFVCMVVEREGEEEEEGRGLSAGVMEVRRVVLVRGWRRFSTWLHVVPAAGLAAAARGATLTGVVGLLSWTVHVLVHTLYPLGRAGPRDRRGGGSKEEEENIEILFSIR